MVRGCVFASPVAPAVADVVRSARAVAALVALAIAIDEPRDDAVVVAVARVVVVKGIVVVEGVALRVGGGGGGRRRRSRHFGRRAAIELSPVVSAVLRARASARSAAALSGVRRRAIPGARSACSSLEQECNRVVQRRANALVTRIRERF